MVYPLVVEVVDGTDEVPAGENYVAVGTEPGTADEGDVVREGSDFLVILASGKFGRIAVERCRFQGFLAQPVDTDPTSTSDIVVGRDPRSLIV